MPQHNLSPPRDARPRRPSRRRRRDTRASTRTRGRNGSAADGDPPSCPQAIYGGGGVVAGAGASAAVARAAGAGAHAERSPQVHAAGLGGRDEEAALAR